MRRLAKRATVVFGAGCVGALANSLVAWLLGAYGVTYSFGVQMAPKLTLPWLYPRIVWGGLWGILFALPMLRNSVWKRGIVVSLGPTLFQLFVVFPYLAGKGVMGLELGNWTPAFVVVLNAVWGVVGALWITYVKE
jgi:hypothetical protein